jgi:hypothetical protein
MTLQMKKNLLQYGDILFLDAQMRQYNKIGWPYIGLAVKSSNNKICVTSESVVLTEDIETYKWIILMQAEMVPAFSIRDILLIFGDGKITDRLLSELGIQDTCLLRCDYYHVMKEIWPNKHNFGIAGFPLIQQHLRAMLLSNTEDEWNFAYKCARDIIKDFPLMVEKLEDVHNKPSYYAGYYLKNIVGNLTLRGSVPAEINYSSINRFFGKGANWTLSYQMMILIERQYTHYLSLRKEIDSYMVEVLCHKSKC